MVSHEIMNSLTPVTSLAQTASGLLDEGDTASAREALVTLERRALGLLRFVEGYRDFARLPSADLQPVSLGVFLEDVARLFQGTHGEGQEKGVGLERGAIVQTMVMIDPDLMAHALLNLLKNAAQSAQARTARVRLAARRIDERVLIEVSDDGDGSGDVDPVEAQKPFFTTKSEGAGVGLTLVGRIAADHGASLEVACPGLDGRGTVVGISVALAMASAG